MGLEKKSPDDSTPRRLYLERNLLIIFGVTLMAVLGVASITPALPNVRIALGIPIEAVSLVVIIFTLPGVLFTPFLGVLADRLGRKIILGPSLFLFGIAGAANALAQNFPMLLVFRFFQGIGAASLGAINVTLIGDLYFGKDRVDAMAYNTSIQGIGTAIYPTLGGLLALLFGWQFPFLLPLVAIPIGLILLLALNNPEPKGGGSFRQYLIQTGKILNNRYVGGLLFASTSAFLMLYGAIITYLPEFMRAAFSADPSIIGLVISSASIASAIIALTVIWLRKRYSARALILIAFPLYALGLFFIPFAPNLFGLLLPVMVFGAAQAFNLPSIQTLLAGLCSPQERAALMSLNGWVLRLGQTLGPLILGIVVPFWGFSGAFWAGALIGLVSLPILLFTIPRGSKEKDSP